MTTITIAADSVKLTKDMIAMLNNPQEHITNIQLDHTSVLMICITIVLIAAFICALIYFMNRYKKQTIIKNLIKNDEDLKNAITEHFKAINEKTLTSIVNEVLDKKEKNAITTIVNDVFDKKYKKEITTIVNKILDEREKNILPNIIKRFLKKGGE